MTRGADPGSGIRLLASRVAAVPAALHELAAMPSPPIDLGGARRVRTTGVGSSQAHARFLAARLERELAIPARFEPLSSLAPPPAQSHDDVLVLFSQGLSPNVRPLLESVERWRRFVLVTAARDRGADSKSALLRRVAERGGVIRAIPGEDEYGTLMRVIGPAVGYLEALRIVRSAAPRGARAPTADVPRFATLWRGAGARLEASLGDAELAALASPDHGLALLAFGGYGELLHNLQCKVLEGMLLPFPPVWDLLEFAHGPFQQAFERTVTLFALMHRGDPAERRLLDRLRGMLVAGRHRLVVLESELAGDLAIFEHEAMWNALVLRYAAERGIDPAHWPGRGADGALYDSDDWPEPAALRAPSVPDLDHRIERLTWPELGRAVASGRTTAILPLGATEQHGPHLPFDTDSRIASALADLLCGEIEEAIRLPTIAVGCSTEHLGFPGTLSIDAATLAATLEALVACVGDAGFRRLFVFSAHGGNYETLRAVLPRLAGAARSLVVSAFLDLDLLARELAAESARDGIPPEHGGHHAGEVETSIVLALEPAAVRRDCFAPGLVTPLDDPQAIFYPSLRAHAPTGVVGDPGRADAERGRRYLARWTAVLAAAYRGEKNHP